MSKHYTEPFKLLLENGFTIKTITPVDNNKKDVSQDIAQLRYKIW